MTSPKEPGQPDPGEDPDAGNGSVGQRSASGRHADAAKAPARKRSTTRSRSTSPRSSTSAPPQEPPVRHSAGVDERLNRFVTGTAAPVARMRSAPDAEADAQPAPAAPPPDAEVARPEVRLPNAYRSELPDLSGPKPRPARTAESGRAADKARDVVPVTSSTVRAGRVGRVEGPVRASMQIRRIDPWSTLKVSLLLSVALFFAWMIAVAFIYLLLGSMGVWSKLNSNVGDLLTNTGGSGELVSSSTIFGAAALIGLVNIVLFTAMATIGALVYNLTTDLVGGIEVTLADRD